MKYWLNDFNQNDLAKTNWKLIAEKNGLKKNKTIIANPDLNFFVLVFFTLWKKINLKVFSQYTNMTVKIQKL